MPGSVVPPAVWDLSQFPGGGRVRFRSDTGELRIRYTCLHSRPGRIQSGLDAYVDGQYWSSAFSGLPGAKFRTGSLTGSGTCIFPLMVVSLYVAG